MDDESVAWNFELAQQASSYLREMSIKLQRTNTDLVRAALVARVDWSGPHRQTFDDRMQQLGHCSQESADLLWQLAARLDRISDEVKEEFERRRRRSSH
jgi:hypothetical protein